MKKWSLLSIPLVALASVWVWSQAVVGAPDENYTGVVVREPDPRSSTGDGLTRHPGVAPLGKPSASAQPPSPNLKSAPLNPASTAPVPNATRLAEPAEPQESSPATDPDSGIVQRVDPTQITSPAVAPTDDPTSHVPFDDSGTDSSNHDY